MLCNARCKAKQQDHRLRVTSMESRLRTTHKVSTRGLLYLQNKVLGYYRINAPSIGYYRITRLPRGLIIFSRETTLSAVSHDNKSKTGSWIVTAPQLRKAKVKVKGKCYIQLRGFSGRKQQCCHNYLAQQILRSRRPPLNGVSSYVT